MKIDEQQVRTIVEEVVRGLAATDGKVSAPAVIPGGGGQDGIFQDMDTAIDAAEIAQRELMKLSLAKRKDIIEALRKVYDAGALADEIQGMN